MLSHQTTCIRISHAPSPEPFCSLEGLRQLCGVSKPNRDSETSMLIRPRFPSFLIDISTDMLASCAWKKVLLGVGRGRMGFPSNIYRGCAPNHGNFLQVRKYMSYQPPKGHTRLLGTPLGLCRNFYSPPIHNFRLLHQGVPQGVIP